MSSAAASQGLTMAMLTVKTNSEFDLLQRVRLLFRDHGREVAEVIGKAEAKYDSAAQEDFRIGRLRDELAEMIQLHFEAVSEKLAAHFDADALRDALLRPSAASSAERSDLHK